MFETLHGLMEMVIKVFSSQSYYTGGVGKSLCSHDDYGMPAYWKILEQVWTEGFLHFPPYKNILDLIFLSPFPLSYVMFRTWHKHLIRNKFLHARQFNLNKKGMDEFDTL